MILHLRAPSPARRLPDAARFESVAEIRILVDICNQPELHRTPPELRARLSGTGWAIGAGKVREPTKVIRCLL
jgi:hypothetical protein